MTGRETQLARAVLFSGRWFALGDLSPDQGYAVACQYGVSTKAPPRPKTTLRCERPDCGAAFDTSYPQRAKYCSPPCADAARRSRRSQQATGGPR